jgi:hypothetical protein
MRVIWSVLLCILLSLPSPTFATTLVGIWTKDRVTIAADSKQTLSDASGRPVGSQNVCKIYQSQNLVFAFAGLAKAEQVDVVEAVRDAHMLTEQGTGKKLPLESIIVAAEAALVRILKARGQSSDSSINVALIIAGKIDGKLQMIREELGGIGISGDFSYPQRSRRIAYPESAGYGGSDPKRGIEVVGINNTVKRFQSSKPDWNSGTDEDVAKRLITVETNDANDSVFVGQPISEIVIKRNDTHWINKGECP